MHTEKTINRLPPWLKVRLTVQEPLAKVRALIRTNNLHTVCASAACPNRTECWNSGTATFMILGNVCTRACRFCNVPKGTPSRPDAGEPKRVARAVKALSLSYAVITSVTRDDLADGGAALFAETIRSIRSDAPGCRVEVLIPDLRGSDEALRAVLAEKPDIVNHNVETVPSLYHRVRPQADYTRSLELLARARALNAVTKSGLMLGLGEGIDELISVLQDLRNAGCSLLTLGQYLQPGKNHLPVEKYYHPEEFDELRTRALALGFHHVASGPLVRSSYHAKDAFSSEGEGSRAVR